jgi:hypothetical protein
LFRSVRWNNALQAKEHGKRERYSCHNKSVLHFTASRSIIENKTTDVEEALGTLFGRLVPAGFRNQSQSLTNQYPALDGDVFLRGITAADLRNSMPGAPRVDDRDDGVPDEHRWRLASLIAMQRPIERTPFNDRSSNLSATRGISAVVENQ